jgi:hypothetical protein
MVGLSFVAPRLARPTTPGPSAGSDTPCMIQIPGRDGWNNDFASRGVLFGPSHRDQTGARWPVPPRPKPGSLSNQGVTNIGNLPACQAPRSTAARCPGVGAPSFIARNEALPRLEPLPTKTEGPPFLSSVRTSARAECREADRRGCAAVGSSPLGSPRRVHAVRSLALRGDRSSAPPKKRGGLSLTISPMGASVARLEGSDALAGTDRGGAFLFSRTAGITLGTTLGCERGMREPRMKLEDISDCPRQPRMALLHADGKAGRVGSGAESASIECARALCDG